MHIYGLKIKEQFCKEAFNSETGIYINLYAYKWELFNFLYVCINNAQPARNFPVSLGLL